MENKIFTISSKKMENDLMYLTLSPKDGKNISFKPGQFVKITSSKKQEDPKFRFYSIASSPNLNNLEFIIKIVGRFTNHLSSLEQGEELEVEGPYGHFAFNEEKNAIFISGGVGIAPMISILKYINEKKLEGNYTLFYSNKNAEFPFYNELIELAKNPSINVVFTITREAPEDWENEKGRVNPELISKYIPNLKNNDYSAFICGPIKMITELKNNLIELGIDNSKIKTEGWG